MKLVDILVKYGLSDVIYDLPDKAKGWEVKGDLELIDEENFDENQGSKISKLPTYLAYAYDKMHKVPHPRLKLAWMSDLTELCVRWSVTVAVAELAAAGRQNELPGWAREVIKGNISRPTLGQWVGILRQLSEKKYNKKRPDPKVAQGIWTLYSKIQKYFDSKNLDGLLSIRNQLAHSGGISREGAQRLWSQAAPAIERLVDQVVCSIHDDDCGNSIIVEAVYDHHLYRLMGNYVEDPVPCPQYIREGQHIREGVYLSVYPNDAQDTQHTREDILRIYLPHFVIFGKVQSKTNVESHDQDADSPVVQIYAKLDKREVVFTPVNADAAASYIDDLSTFEAFFGLNDRDPTLKLIDGYTCEDYIHSLRMYNQLYGRRLEEELITHWLSQPLIKDPSSCIGWFGGETGVGKSHLIASIAYNMYIERHLDHSIPVFYHHFERGDHRCSRDAFLRLFSQRLHQLISQATQANLSLDPNLTSTDLTTLYDTELEAHIVELLKYLRGTQDSQTPNLLIFLDGVDRVDTQNNNSAQTLERGSLLDLIEELVSESEFRIRFLLTTSGQKPPNTVRGFTPTPVLLETKPAHTRLTHELNKTKYKEATKQFFKAQIERLKEFKSVLLRLEDKHIRGILLNSSQQLNVEISALGKAEVNPFLAVITKAAAGSPLYVHLVLQELEQGRLKVSADPQLPQGVKAYFFNMLQRMSFGDETRILPLVLCILGQACAELSTLAITQLTFNTPTPSEVEVAQVTKLLQQMEGVYERTTVNEDHTRDRWLLRDGSLRTMLQANQGAGTPELKYTRREAMERFCTLANQWSTLPAGSLRAHLFTFDLKYALTFDHQYTHYEAEAHEGNKAKMQVCKTVAKRFTHIDYLMTRVEEISHEGLISLTEDYNRLIKLFPSNDSLKAWGNFFRKNLHILLCGTEAWSSQKIFFQLAIDEAHDSVVSRAADTWLAKHNFTELWLRREPSSRRPFTIPSAIELSGTLGSSIQWIHRLSDQHFLCGTKEGSTVHSCGVYLYSKNRAKPLWKREYESADKIRTPPQTVILQTAEKDSICVFALWREKSPIVEIIALEIGLIRCSIRSTSKETKSSLTLTHKNSLRGAVKLDHQSLITWVQGKKATVQLWRWGHQEIEHIELDVGSIRDLLMLNTQDCLVTHDGKHLQSWRWSWADQSTTLLTSLKQDQAYKYGKIWTLDDSYVLTVSTTKKSEPPVLRLLKVDSQDAHRDAQDAHRDAQDAHRDAQDVHRDAQDVQSQTLNHPHEQWITSVLSDSSGFWTADAHHICRWEWKRGDDGSLYVERVDPQLPSLHSKDQKILGGSKIDQSLVWFGENGLLLVWSKGELRQILPEDQDAHRGHITGVIPIRVGQSRRGQFVSASNDNDLRLWSINSKQLNCRGCFSGHNDKITQLAHLSSNYIVSGSTSGRFFVWSLEPNRARRLLEITRSQPPRLPFIRVAIRIDDVFIVGHQGLHLSLWGEGGSKRELDTRIPLQGANPSHNIDHLYDSSSVDQSSFLVIVNRAQSVFLYTVPHLKLLKSLDHPLPIKDHLFIQDEKLLIICMKLSKSHSSKVIQEEKESEDRVDHEIWVWDLNRAPHDLEAKRFKGHCGAIIGMKSFKNLKNNNNRVLSWDESGEVIYWSIDEMKIHQRLTLTSPDTSSSDMHISHIPHIEMFDEHNQFISWDESGGVYIWDMDRGVDDRGADDRGADDEIKLRHSLSPQKEECIKIDSAQLLSDQTLVVWKNNTWIAFWDMNGNPLGVITDELWRGALKRVTLYAEGEFLLHEKGKNKGCWLWRVNDPNRLQKLTIEEEDSFNVNSNHTQYKVSNHGLIVSNHTENQLQHMFWFSADGVKWDVLDVDPSGAIVLKMNRTLYKLQLMKGNQTHTFHV